MYNFRPFIAELGKFVNVEYDIVEDKDELDVKLHSINGVESSSRGTFAGFSHVTIYNQALNDYFTNHAPDEWD